MLSNIVSITMVIMLMILAGCVMHETYGDHTLQENELAFVQGYWRYKFLYDEELHIVSVDGKQKGERRGWPYAYSVSLPPGKHWLQFAVLRNSQEITMCAFESTFVAQHRYKLQHLDHNQLLLAHPATPTFNASISIAVTAPDDTVRHFSVPAVCGSGPMCRRDFDCPSNSSCQKDADRDFGICKNK